MKRITKEQIESAISFVESNVDLNPENKKLDYTICYEDNLKDAIIVFITIKGFVSFPLIPTTTESIELWMDRF